MGILLSISECSNIITLCEAISASKVMKVRSASSVMQAFPGYQEQFNRALKSTRNNIKFPRPLLENSCNL